MTKMTKKWQKHLPKVSNLRKVQASISYSFQRLSERIVEYFFREKIGKTMEKVLIKNYVDIANAAAGSIQPSQIRSVEIEALVDTGASCLCLPPKVIKELGLLFAYSTPVKTGNGKLELRIFDGAKITIRERTIQMQVMENINDDVPALIGYLVLETMDWVVNPKTQEIMGNPENDGKWVMDMY